MMPLGLVAECYHLRMLMRMMGIKTDIVVSGSLSTQEELHYVTESALNFPSQSGYAAVGARSGKKMTVDDIMVPRSEIIGIDINDDWKSILRQLSPHLTGASCSTVIRTTPSVCCST